MTEEFGSRDLDEVEVQMTEKKIEVSVGIVA